MAQSAPDDSARQPFTGLAGFFAFWHHAAMTTDEPNGILPYILGAVIGGTASTLPRPGPGQPTERTAEVDTGKPYGLVRIRYRLMRYRHGKSDNWFWTAVHAERVA